MGLYAFCGLEASRFRQADGLRCGCLVTCDQRLQHCGDGGACAPESVAHICQPSIGCIQLGVSAPRWITQQQRRRSLGCDAHPIRQIAGLAGRHRAG
jgi:hypothetical protein